MQNERYFSHSWALLTRDKGWYKPLLVMTAASFVPVAGALGNKGYAMEYARLTAWGVDASPKQKNVDVVKCISSGWRGFVVDLGVWILFGLAFGLISTVFAFVPGPLGRGLGILWSLISWAIAVLVGVGLYVAEIRAAIYEKISAGFRLGHIFEMIRRDFGGFDDSSRLWRIRQGFFDQSRVLGHYRALYYGVHDHHYAAADAYLHESYRHECGKVQLRRYHGNPVVALLGTCTNLCADRSIWLRPVFHSVRESDYHDERSRVVDEAV